MTTTDNWITSTEVFPVKTESMPTLTAYRLDAGNGDTISIGGKLSYRLRRRLPGRWIWSGWRIVTDTPVREDELKSALAELWSSFPDVYRNLRSIYPDRGWRPSAQTYADFVARGLAEEARSEVIRVLRSEAVDLGNATITRVHDVRGWVAGGMPAASISLVSRLSLKDDLSAYCSHARQPTDAVGLLVADKTSTLKGEVVRIVGPLREQRDRLIALTDRPEMQQLLESGDDADPVVAVRVGRNEYDYTSGALDIIVRTQDWGRFGVDGGRTSRHLRLSPAKRGQIITDVSDVFKHRGWLGPAINSRQAPELFRLPPNGTFTSNVRFGGPPRPYDSSTLLRHLRGDGVYRKSDRYATGHPIRAGIIDTSSEKVSKQLIRDIESELKQIDFGLDVVGTEHVTDFSRAGLERATGELQSRNADVILAILPEEHGEDDEDWGLYDHFKSLTISRGTPSQVILEPTVQNRAAMGNVLLGVLGKTGNIPFILNEPLEFADVVVGLDIARRRKTRLEGSVNATAVARIYFGNGEFVRYVIHDAPLDGETVPASVLQSLFPMDEFKGKRVVVHRDGYFRGDERQVLGSWGDQIGATFMPVEVLKSGTPRLYGFQGRSPVAPSKGTTFVLDDTQAFVVSSILPFKGATPQPLQIRARDGISIDNAIESVLALTTLHYGSVRPPRLPVTIHYSDRIAYLALRGIKPKNLEGNVPFWL